MATSPCSRRRKGAGASGTAAGRESSVSMHRYASPQKKLRDASSLAQLHKTLQRQQQLLEEIRALLLEKER